ncbi:MAG TPA: hypothetical protein VF719_08735 [Abditibacteriaceae bacterium]|jgi:hypothetical protein
MIRVVLENVCGNNVGLALSFDHLKVLVDHQIKQLLDSHYTSNGIPIEGRNVALVMEVAGAPTFARIDSYI